jgi:SSS family solute:Na+ symporter
MVAVVCLLFFVVGTTLFAFYHQGLPPDAPANSGFPKLAREDQIVPYFVLKHVPYPGLVGLLLAGLFAASMSSIDSGINSLTATVVCDWLPEHRLGLRVSRLLCIGFGIAAILISIMLAPFKDTPVFSWIMRIAGTFLGPLLAVFLLGMYVRRANAAGVLAGMAAGMVALGVALWYTAGQLSEWWFGAVTCVPTFVVGAAASLLFAAPSESELRNT